MIKFIPVTEGDDLDLNDNERLAYSHVENLGHGHSAIVEKIQDMATGVYLARKTFRLHRRQAQQRQTFRNEIAIIRRLAANHHVIRVFATFTSKQEVGIILHPVADGGDLKSFLHDCQEVPQPSTAQRAILRSGFGCLSVGLAFIHEQGIRHKDIKPGNILIHQGNMIYTDFGYSLKYDIAGNSTTYGKPEMFTAKYCAPEVKNEERRNSKADVFSLGCVLLELLAVYSDPNLASQFTPDPYHESIDAIQRKLTTPCDVSSSDYPWLRTIISSMIDASPNLRPRATNVVNQIRDKDQDYFCPSCTSSNKQPLTGSSGGLGERTESTTNSNTGRSNDVVAKVPLVRRISNNVPVTGNSESLGESSGSDTDSSTSHSSIPDITEFSLDIPSTRNSRAYRKQLVTMPDSITAHSSIPAINDSSQEPANPLVAPDIRSTIPNFIAGTPHFGWHDSIDPSYRMRTHKEAEQFFLQGRVFSLLDPSVGSANAASSSEEPYAEIVKVGEAIFVQLRNFIVVRVREGYVEAVGIFTYSNKGTLNPGCDASKHAVVYSMGEDPVVFEGEVEKGLAISPFQVGMVNPNGVLPPASRIRFETTYSVECNNRVKDLGIVVPNDLRRLILYWIDENRVDDEEGPVLPPRKPSHSLIAPWHDVGGIYSPGDPPYWARHNSPLYQEAYGNHGNHTPRVMSLDHFLRRQRMVGNDQSDLERNGKENLHCLPPVTFPHSESRPEDPQYQVGYDSQVPQEVQPDYGHFGYTPPGWTRASPFVENRD
ncbi:kinase-like protein [Aaosphaeria arxii CBS 175.79]|uniref:Kinase-like protein n=1 Tax=Aaosphaeria arxii CBS 175.79 TaxID=1450172 RepID=A0A6A5XT55_9PLEO|nr:kinase-like protein [Aaosphaeria arxii CBS 175.79]KAF2016515.1 kinase-like protein [Aaosphaeria arxii CBS 175.79]